MVHDRECSHNGAGGQNYIWVQEAARDKTYHVMLTVKKDGTCSCYINGKLAKTVKNSSLANTTVYLRVEGSARLNGDSVNATFSNIELKLTANIMQIRSGVRMTSQPIRESRQMLPDMRLPSE